MWRQLLSIRTPDSFVVGQADAVCRGLDGGSCIVFLTNRLLQFFLGRFVRTGSVTVTTSAGATFTCGDGTGPRVAVKLKTSAAARALLLDPELALGEIYMEGAMTLREGSIADLLAIALGQPDTMPRWATGRRWLRRLFRRWQQFNLPARSRRNVASHYDLDARLYRLFLDADMQYSCAYFETPQSTLEEAQLAKKRHLAAKLLVRPDDRVLDIGCGWGGLGLYLADVAAARVTGITLSEEQLVVATARAGRLGLGDRVSFLLEDYRETPGKFDRIISVGMFEHVGVDFYDTYFTRCADLLTDEGVMVLHSIGRSEGPGITNPWIAKHIFPGGYIPAVSEVLPAIERAGLLVTDTEILRLHYAETLTAWRARFLARREDVTALYDERFVRMWEFYLAASEMSFRKQNLMVFQIQLSKRQDVVPMTRDYIAREEQRLRGIETAGRPSLHLVQG
jgi:cyclopropane-fatty-acyl-phospholipid synthase